MHSSVPKSEGHFSPARPSHTCSSNRSLFVLRLLYVQLGRWGLHLLPSLPLPADSVGASGAYPGVTRHTPVLVRRRLPGPPPSPLAPRGYWQRGLVIMPSSCMVHGGWRIYVVWGPPH